MNPRRAALPPARGIRWAQTDLSIVAAAAHRLPTARWARRPAERVRQTLTRSSSLDPTQQDLMPQLINDPIIDTGDKRVQLRLAPDEPDHEVRPSARLGGTVLRSAQRLEAIESVLRGWLATHSITLLRLSLTSSDSDRCVSSRDAFHAASLSRLARASA